MTRPATPIDIAEMRARWENYEPGNETRVGLHPKTILEVLDVLDELEQARASIAAAVTLLRTARHSLVAPGDVLTALGACPHDNTVELTKLADQRVRLLCTTCSTEIDGGPR